MDPVLYKTVITCQIASLRELASSDLTVFRQVTTQEDNILHIAAKYDHKEVAEEIIKLPPLASLVTQKNSKGDTPLHVAARLGSLETARVLINCANSMSREIEAGERLVWMVNSNKDTALHDAARNGHFPIAKLLIGEDPELSLSTNDLGESPLFVAVDKKHFDIANEILELAPPFSCAGRNKMNALHAAVVRSQDEVIRLSLYMLEHWSHMDFITNMSYKHFFKFSSFGPSTLIEAAYRNSIFKGFVASLTEKCQSAISESDEYGWTPLHYAVHFGAEEIVEVFLKYIDSATAYITDNEGISLIHIAAREGEVAIMKMLVYHYPQMLDLQDNKGQTALHLAVARGKLDSVKFILGVFLSHDGLINQQDNEGNTALHLAVILGHQGKIFDLLIKDSRVDKTVTNMEGFAVIDLLLLKEYGYFEKNWVLMTAASNGGMGSLEHAVNKNGRKIWPIDQTIETEQPQQLQSSQPASDTPDESQQRQFIAIRRAEPAALGGLKKHSYDQLQNIANIDLLVTTLIATVSFAAGFTMPGGYKSDGSEEGMAILSKKTAFRVFVISNALAFCLSSTSMFVHYCKSFVEKVDALSFYTNITAFLTSCGITAMVIAFVSGTYATLADSPGLAKAVLSIGCSFFGLQLVVYLK